jgi:5-methylcytosine-specific restriction endonuclease McrA
MCTFPDQPSKYAYNKGCRCPSCRTWRREAEREYKTREDAKIKHRERQKKYHKNSKFTPAGARRQSRNAQKRSLLRLENKFTTEKEKKRIQEIYQKAKELSAATGIKHHVDHIIPLSKGGTHHPDNLQILTEDQNTHKGTRMAYTHPDRIKKALSKIVEQYGRVLKALAGNNKSILTKKQDKPTLWD